MATSTVERPGAPQSEDPRDFAPEAVSAPAPSSLAGDEDFDDIDEPSEDEGEDEDDEGSDADDE